MTTFSFNDIYPQVMWQSEELNLKKRDYLKMWVKKVWSFAEMTM